LLGRNFCAAESRVYHPLICASHFIERQSYT
jgi:hypothetical protein